RHAHHRGREEPLGLLERLEVAAGCPVPCLREVPQAQAVRPDEGHLGGGEERGDADGDDDQPDVDHAAAPARPVSRRVTSTSTSRVRETFSTETTTFPTSSFSPL